jgi:hypothetical protein
MLPLPPSGVMYSDTACQKDYLVIVGGSQTGFGPISMFFAKDRYCGITLGKCIDTNFETYLKTQNIICHSALTKRCWIIMRADILFFSLLDQNMLVIKTSRNKLLIIKCWNRWKLNNFEKNCLPIIINDSFKMCVILSLLSEFFFIFFYFLIQDIVEQWDSSLLPAHLSRVQSSVSSIWSTVFQPRVFGDEIMNGGLVGGYYRLFTVKLG